MKVLLFSGGLDSTAIAHWLRPDALLFINYGQIPAEGEKRAVLQIAAELGLKVDIRNIDAKSLGAGDLVGLPSIEGCKTEFWPFRNQFLITIAAMAYATKLPLEILVGTVSSDSVHADGTMNFIHHMNDVLSTQGDLTLRAPAIKLSTRELLTISGVSQNTLGWTFSCHVAENACGQCRGCTKHFEEIGAI